MIEKRNTVEPDRTRCICGQLGVKELNGQMYCATCLERAKVSNANMQDTLDIEKMAKEIK